MQDIDRDLVRWQRGKWAAVVLIVFIAQVSLFIAASQKEMHSRKIYPAEPEVAFAPRSQRIHREWLELENPFLFAAASWNGFSGEAWLRQPEWNIPEPQLKSDPGYLKLEDSKPILKEANSERSFSFLPPRRTATVLSTPDPAPISPIAPQVSNLSVAGFSGRTLATSLPLPVQYHSDVLSSTTVEAMIDRDGLVISARVIDGSGSTKADSDALALAGKARFLPAKYGEIDPAVGKLIFEWFTLHLSDTNNVKR